MTEKAKSSQTISQRKSFIASKMFGLCLSCVVCDTYVAEVSVVSISTACDVNVVVQSWCPVVAVAFVSVNKLVVEIDNVVFDELLPFVVSAELPVIVSVDVLFVDAVVDTGTLVEATSEVPFCIEPVTAS